MTLTDFDMTTLTKNNAQSQTSSAKKILVAYFSHSGNTREIGRQIQDATDADGFEIAPVDAYPTDYDLVVEQAKRELQANHRPVLNDKVPNMDLYDVVFVGSPNWWSTIAPPVMTFLSSYNFAGKTVVPFITHEGSRLGKSVADVKRLSSGAEVLDGHAFWGSRVRDAREDVASWLAKMDLLRSRK
jgi:flavodoxin